MGFLFNWSMNKLIYTWSNQDAEILAQNIVGASHSASNFRCIHSALECPIYLRDVSYTVFDHAYESLQIFFEVRASMQCSIVNEFMNSDAAQANMPGNFE
jgi:hypothetical protein